MTLLRPPLEVELSETACRVLDVRYLRRDSEGRICETPTEMFWRVARGVAQAEPEHERVLWSERFFHLMAQRLFLPNSPTLMNAGLPNGQLSACFVLPVEDSIEGIFATLGQMAQIQKSGGGTGFSFTRLRPAGDVVQSTGGVASGPVSFMDVFDSATGVVKQGGRRRGANMGILRIDHPDILAFIESKADSQRLTSFNISVGVTDAFIEALRAGASYALVNPRSGEPVARLESGEVWRRIVEMAWQTGDPGLVFLDRINAANPTPMLGEIIAVNPCGEQPLLPYEACNLGSINLAVCVSDGQFDWARFEAAIDLGVRFLDDVIQVNCYPFPEIDAICRANRKIGLGVMGFAEMLIQLGIAYESPETLELAEQVQRRLTDVGRQASVELARTRGSFANFAESIWPEQGLGALRNATVSTVAPTGTISLIAGTSSGIEPLYSVAHNRQVVGQGVLRLVNPLFRAALVAAGLDPEPIVEAALEAGSIQQMEQIPPSIRRLFPCAADISPSFHVQVQAAFQRHTDSAVSKTVNLSAAATIADIDEVYRLAIQSGCKGITVFRDGCRGEQVLFQNPDCPRCQ